jgi:Kef-type K+ transport system membrane component KefB
VTADLEFVNLLVVAVLAVVAPIVATALPIRIPSVVLEIVAGIVVGPSVLGWVDPDPPVVVLALVGLAFLLFLSGLEIDLRGLRGETLRLPLLGFLLTLVLGMALGFGADAIGWVRDPFFLAVALGATSLGIVAPVLKDSGHASRPLGQYTLAGATVADFATILLLSLVFAESEGGTASRLSSVALFVVATLGIALVLGRAERSMGLDRLLVGLQDTTAAIRVRIAVAIMLGFVALAAEVGLETILGAFVAGAVLALVDRDTATHPHFHLKLESIGYGFLVPVFFITSGLRFDLRSLTDEPSALLRVPVFLVALLIVRGLPALLYRRSLGRDATIVAALLQATSLPFIVTATQIGVAVDAVAPVTAAALVAAGLLSTVVFPALALARLARVDDVGRAPAQVEVAHRPMGTQF